MKNLFRKVAFAGMGLLALLGIGCSTAQPTREERLYKNLDAVNDLGYINAGNKFKRREMERTANMVKDVNQYVDEKTKGEAEGVQKIRKLNQDIKDLEKSVLDKSKDLIDEYKGLSEDYRDEMSTIFSDIDSRYDNENFRRDSEKTYNLFGISPFLGLIRQNNAADSKVNVDDNTDVTYGLKLSKDFGRISPFALWEQSRSNDIEKDGATYHSDIDSLMTTFGAGVDFNLYKGKFVDVDLGAYLARTTEAINGDLTINGNNYSINEKDSFLGLGYDLSAAFGSKKAKFKISAGGINYPGWLNDSDSQNSKALSRYTIGGEFNF